jgi:hypothetical protein
MHSLLSDDLSGNHQISTIVSCIYRSTTDLGSRQSVRSYSSLEAKIPRYEKSEGLSSCGTTILQRLTLDDSDRMIHEWVVGTSGTSRQHRTSQIQLLWKEASLRH